MKIEQTKCGFCAKIHNTPSLITHLTQDQVVRLIRIHLMVEGKKSPFDFCYEECLLNFLTAKFRKYPILSTGSDMGCDGKLHTINELGQKVTLGE
jgi:hypothetical protein